MIDFRRLCSAREPLFAEASALYETGFPPHERRPLEKQKAVMNNPLYHFGVITEGGALAGLMLYWEPAKYAYIEHFAIARQLRGKSLGSKILAAFCAGRPLVILEIDPPVTEISVRREAFYGRLVQAGT